jgi:hypothetical protein
LGLGAKLGAERPSLQEPACEQEAALVLHVARLAGERLAGFLLVREPRDARLVGDGPLVQDGLPLSP